ncbi:MAG: SLC13 family permease [Bacteroidales bacterium]
MTVEILLVYFILLSALVLFFTSWVRMDVVALLVLSSLTIFGLITPVEALAGFSNPAVITVWGMFILSAGLYQTGVAKMIGRRVLQLAGKGEMRMIITIMLISGLLSTIMNNVGVAALMLPVVMDVARSTQRAPSRLLMPLAFGVLLGGMTTLIGTPPNLLASYALQEAGLEAFRLFDYAPIGLAALAGGILFMVFIGRHLLPHRDLIREKGPAARKGLPAYYGLQELTFRMRLRPESQIVGKTLAESRLRTAMGLNVLSVNRKEGGGTILDPGPHTLLRPNDTLFVQGRLDVVKTVRQWKLRVADQQQLEGNRPDLEQLKVYEATLGPESKLIGQCPADPEIRQQLGAHILAIRQKDGPRASKFFKIVLEASDVLLLFGSSGQIDSLQQQGLVKDVTAVSAWDAFTDYQLYESLFFADIDQSSTLPGRPMAASQLAEASGLIILGILRQGQPMQMPTPEETYQQGDQLLIKGNIKDLSLLQGLVDVDLLEEAPPRSQRLEAGEVQMAEAVLAPRSQLAGKTLPEINFRQKYGVTVLAIWRKGEVYRTNLHRLPLNFGEAFLLYGTRPKLELLGDESDFILLTDTLQKPLRTHKALTSILIMVGVLIPVLFGLIPLAIMALVGVCVMVLTGCLKMDEAYRAIEWRSVFLIAGLLPLGTAMHQTGAAELMAQGVIDIFGRFGPWGVVAGLHLFTLAGTLVIPPSALVVIMSPVALQAAASFDISAHAIMMAIVMAAAPSFMSPVSQHTNLMVMGPGGYKFIDYIKVGLPMAIVVIIILALLLPVLWPL